MICSSCSESENAQKSSVTGSTALLTPSSQSVCNLSTESSALIDFNQRRLRLYTLPLQPIQIRPTLVCGCHIKTRPGASEWMILMDYRRLSCYSNKTDACATLGQNRLTWLRIKGLLTTCQLYFLSKCLLKTQIHFQNEHLLSVKYIVLAVSLAS